MSMRRKRGRLAGFGLFVIILGLIWLLADTGFITWSVFHSLYVLWPLILVVIGISVIFRRSVIVRTLAWLVFLAVLVSYSYFYGNTGSHGNFTGGVKNVTVEKNAEVQKANLKIAFGGTNIKADSNTSNLLDATLQDLGIGHSVDYTNGNSAASIVFEKSRYVLGDLNIKGKTNTFHLNNGVLWNLDIDTGAVDGNLDLSGLKTGNIDINMGAANMKLLLGECDTKLKINAGISQINIEIPDNAGIKVTLDGGLNSTNLDNPGWVYRDGSYYSPGYDGKQYKMEADIHMGLGSLTVNNR